MILKANTKYGPLQGVRSVVEGLAEFRGIPYAKPPVGKRRWAAPEECDIHDEVMACDRYANCAMQPIRKSGDFYLKEFYTHRFHKYPPAMSEDCLYLNIWTPAETKADKLPVFVWIHGGGFIQGYSHEPRTNGEVMASKGIVVVSINYRLGIMGFFAHPELTEEQGGHSGNYALMDQIMAINWIYDNISEFGGDPENITIGGQSAGSFSVEALSVAPGTKGKIKRAIMQSGVVTPPDKYGDFYLPLSKVESQAEAFCRFAGKTLKELRDASQEEIMELYLGYIRDNGIQFRAYAEDDHMFKENPLESFIKGREHISELLIGATKEESMLMPRDETITKENYYNKVKNCFGEEMQLMEEVEVSDDEDAKRCYNSWFSWYQNNGSQALAEIVSSHPGKRAYAYSFERRLPGKDDPGSFHSACLWYMFGNLHNARRPFTDGDYDLEELMNGCWAGFIKNGDPNFRDDVCWPCFDKNRKSAVLSENGMEIKDISEERPDWFRLRDRIVK